MRTCPPTLTAPAVVQSSAAPPASPAAIPDGTALDSPPPVAVGAGHARTQPPEAADVEQATHPQAARLPQGARGAHRPDVRHATDEPRRERRDPAARGPSRPRASSSGGSSATRSPTRSRRSAGRRRATSAQPKSPDTDRLRPGANGHDDADRHPRIRGTATTSAIGPNSAGTAPPPASNACFTASASRRWSASPTSPSIPGRAYLVERGLEEDGYAALLALVADYLETANQLGVPPMSTTIFG